VFLKISAYFGAWVVDIFKNTLGSKKTELTFVKSDYIYKIFCFAFSKNMWYGV
jgi:hypothetical protein